MCDHCNQILGQIRSRASLGTLKNEPQQLLFSDLSTPIFAQSTLHVPQGKRKSQDAAHTLPKLLPTAAAFLSYPETKRLADMNGRADILPRSVGAEVSLLGLRKDASSQIVFKHF